MFHSMTCLLQPTRPDGRIFQVEYALKAVENSGTCIGIRVKDGVVLAHEKLVQSKLLVPGSNRRIQTVDQHIGMVGAGLLADSRHLVSRARDEAGSYRDNYKTSIPSKIIVDRVAAYVSAFTLYSSVRPFGIATLIASMDTNGAALYMVEPSGVYYGYNGCAIGKGKQIAKTEIEKLKFDELTPRQAVNEAARIIHMAHNEAKDKDFELELTWICAESNYKHQVVPEAISLEASRLAKAVLTADEMEED
ncbi:hypothetical protein BASA62_000211 [Batrachochytrium salamandrivorans]|nr:hypothetical protein BASA62_000211 [Batrachochytrium salamandrivorans]